MTSCYLLRRGGSNCLADNALTGLDKINGPIEPYQTSECCGSRVKRAVLCSYGNTSTATFIGTKH